MSSKSEIKASKNNEPKMTKDQRTIRIIIIVIVVIIALTILIIIIMWLTSNGKKHHHHDHVPHPHPHIPCNDNTDCPTGEHCLDGKCVYDQPQPPCNNEPGVPLNVTIQYDQLAMTATLSWSPVDKATLYRVYRKLNDPSVSKLNADEQVEVAITTANFTNLPVGTSFYVVTAVNTCGESDESVPVKLAPACTSVPTTPDSPIVTQDSNNCPNADFANISFDDQSIPNGVYILSGTGQIGNVGNYLALVDGGLYGPFSVALKCGGVQTYHRVQYVTDVQQTPITSAPIVTTGNTITISWTPILGAEEYVIWLVGADVETYFYGGFAQGNTSTITLPVQSGLTPIFGVVLGYKLCDKSESSNNASYTTF